ncbi:MAG: DinB family protein [Chloroflexi bacterium]|nr:DinB family protein [Chloroflexota bacterium]MBU1746606.1 DinB family protein [Chloroflexota bacterium]
MDEKARLIEELDRSRAELWAALAGLDQQYEIYPNWTIKHLLAHLAGWDDATIATLRAHAVGEEPATPAVYGIDVYNAQSVEERVALSYEQVVQECNLTREQVKAAIRDLPPAKMDERLVTAWGPKTTVDRLVRTFVEHEKEHAHEIRELTGQQGPADG